MNKTFLPSKISFHEDHENDPLLNFKLHDIFRYFS